MSLLEKALATKGEKKNRSWADAAVHNVTVEDLAELIGGWAQGMITAEDVLRTLAPAQVPQDEKTSPANKGNTLILAAVRRLVRNGGTLLPFDRDE